MMREELFELSEFTKEREEQGSLSESCNSGYAAEAFLVYQACKRGFTVFKPDSHSTKIDLVLHKPNCKLIGVQVKKATLQRSEGRRYFSDTWKFMVGAGRPSRARDPVDRGPNYVRYQRGDFDVLAAYIAERESFVFYLLDEICDKSTKNWSEGHRENNWEIFDQFTL
jgi:hypothetical protein